MGKKTNSSKHNKIRSNIARIWADHSRSQLHHCSERDFSRHFFDFVLCDSKNYDRSKNRRLVYQVRTLVSDYCALIFNYHVLHHLIIEIEWLHKRAIGAVPAALLRAAILHVPHRPSLYSLFLVNGVQRIGALVLGRRNLNWFFI